MAAGSTSVFVPAERADGEDSDSADAEGSAQDERSQQAVGDKLAAVAAAKAGSGGEGGIGVVADARVEAQRAKQDKAAHLEGTGGGVAAAGAGLAAMQAKVAAAERAEAAAERPAGTASPGHQLHGSLSIFEREAGAVPDAAFTIATAPQAEAGLGLEAGGDAQQEAEEEQEDSALAGSPDVAINLLPPGAPLSGAAAADRAALEMWRRSSSLGSGSGRQQRGSNRGGLRRRTTSTHGEP